MDRIGQQKTRAKKSKRAFPKWFEERVRNTFTAKFAGGHVRRVDFWDAWRAAQKKYGQEWFDHDQTWTIEDEDIFVTEAECTEAGIKAAKRLGEQIGCCVDTYKLPNGDIRFIFSRFGWSERDPLATT